MLRILSLAVLVVGLSASAFAAPVSILDVRDELRDRGASSLHIAYLSGHPVITGEMEENGFTAVLRECHESRDACEAIRFKACRTAYTLTRGDLLEIANEYNTGYGEGAAFLEDDSTSDTVICVRWDVDMTKESEFGISQSFGWSRVLTKFVNFANTRITDRTAATILDVSN